MGCVYNFNKRGYFKVLLVKRLFRRYFLFVNARIAKRLTASFVLVGTK